MLLTICHGYLQLPQAYLSLEHEDPITMSLSFVDLGFSPFNLTIGKTTKQINGTADVSFSAEEITDKFIESIETVFHACDTRVVFGQVNVQEWLECSKSKATNVMKAMKTAKIIKKVPGAGFGRYQFIEL